MARKTFISYKYSEATQLRDVIIQKMGDDARYYTGETSDSPDMTGSKTETIKENLKDMMYRTSVSIVIISPNMKQSNWIDWEIEYTLKRIKRGDLTSASNGLLGVIMKYNGGYDWLISTTKKDDGCSSRSFNTSLLYDIINGNRFNRKGEEKYSCTTCKSYDWLDGSYMSLITEDTFLKDINKYIENAYDKSKIITEFEPQRQK
jgi:hypothetical protein